MFETTTSPESETQLENGASYVSPFATPFSPIASSLSIVVDGDEMKGKDVI